MVTLQGYVPYEAHLGKFELRIGITGTARVCIILS